MNHQVEEAAHQASKVPLLVAWAGNGFGFLVAHEKELQVTVLVLTILWTLWQWGKSLLQDGRDRAAHQNEAQTGDRVAPVAPHGIRAVRQPVHGVRPAATRSTSGASVAAAHTARAIASGDGVGVHCGEVVGAAGEEALAPPGRLDQIPYEGHNKHAQQHAG